MYFFTPLTSEFPFYRMDPESGQGSRSAKMSVIIKGPCHSIMRFIKHSSMVWRMFSCDVNCKWFVLNGLKHAKPLEWSCKNLMMLLSTAKYSILFPLIHLLPMETICQSVCVSVFDFFFWLFHPYSCFSYCAILLFFHLYNVCVPLIQHTFFVPTRLFAVHHSSSK